ncbi:MAG: hypothetical protein OXH76_21435 [Boseongicola sp.]|nr:hypothetical protein [Boseongicola sp.]
MGEYLRRAFPGHRNRRILAQIGERLASNPPICCLEADTSSWVLGLIGHAIDYRIRLHFAHFPSGNLRLARDGAWMVARLDDFISLLRASPSRFPGFAVTPFGDAPSGTANWQHLSDEETEDGDVTIWKESDAAPDSGPSFSLACVMADALHRNLETRKLKSACILEFFDLLDETVTALGAHARPLSPSEERRLARCCLILAVFESIRRSGRAQLPEFLEVNVPGDAEGLLGAVPQPWADDVAELAISFRHRHADWHGTEAVLNPEFEGSRDVGGADGDLVVNGCLWDLKTTLKKRAEGTWLYQLLGYVLLDYEDRHAIDHVGLQFPRQAASVHWPLQELADELSGTPDVSIAAMRQEIRDLLRNPPPASRPPATSEPIAEH